MKNNHIKEKHQDCPDIGKLRLQVQALSEATPIKDAVIYISKTDEPDNVIEQVRTNLSGMSDFVELSAPPVEYSLESKQSKKPYAEYTFRIEAAGYEDVTITGAQILSNQTAIQSVHMHAADMKQKSKQIRITPHTLYGNYSPKIAEAEIKPMNQPEERSLKGVIVPEFVVVHDGTPRDKSAKDYYVRYKDYIKNVASGEIYATWPEASITANILAIMSFTMNRVYTKWYQNKGFHFTITSSTSFDHKWVYGRNIFLNISQIVDEIFSKYLSRPNVKQPILLQYCDGERIQCPNWMSKWGARTLGEQGTTAIGILQHYYGDDLYINTAKGISGIPYTWTGYHLSIESGGPGVEQIQREINIISNKYPFIPKVGIDGIYGYQTQNAVRLFQELFGLPKTGIINYGTWHKIQEIYTIVTRKEELF